MGELLPRGHRRPHEARVRGRGYVGRPQVAYRETVRQAVQKVEGKFIRQTGGSGQYGVVYIDLEPAPGEGFDFVNKIKGGSVPRSSSPPLSRRASRRRSTGVKARLPDGRRPRDADRRQVPRHGLLGDRVQGRGSLALKEAAKRAKPVLLEPVMAVEVVAPQEYLGDVIGDISRRRGRSRARSRAATQSR